jgi:hypothetical protein
MTSIVRIDCGPRHPVAWIDRSEARFGLRIAGNGSYNLLVWCLSCDRWATGAVGLHVLDGSGAAATDFPVVADYRGVIGRCARRGCDQEAIEDHHFAPQAVFREEADDWPRALLCREHHMEWHRRMGAA